MHIFIVYAHPYEKSFTASILESFIEGITLSGHTYEVSDLYKMNFNSDLGLDDYLRESNQILSKPVPEDVKMEQEKMNRADMIVFIYPLWWSDCPAKLKGWFDRVYTVGYAYTAEEFQSKLTVKRGLVICTAGNTEEYLEETGIAESMRKVMLLDRLMNVGIKEGEFIILGGTADKNQDVYKKHRGRIFELGQKL